MTRVATIPQHRILFDAIERSQNRLSQTQLQLATGKKAQKFSDLGTETVRNLSAHTLLARHESHALVATRLGTTLSIYDASISSIDEAAAGLRESLLNVIGSNRSAGLPEIAEAAFQQFRSSLNSTEGGIPIFAGTRTDESPFVPEKLADTAGLNPDQAFRNDDVKATSRVADGLDVRHGILANELGSGILGAFRTIAEAGAIGEVPTASQIDAMKTALQQLDTGLQQVRSIQAENGRIQSQIEVLGARSEDRAIVLRQLISNNEDANMAQIAADLSQRQSVLEASYSVFGKLSGLSLVNYLR
jgi:flagellar hook-associated protein 3 FlgL